MIRELERIFEQREEWLKDSIKFCDFDNPNCILGWSNSYLEECLYLLEDR